jgi:hypothetical protein
MKIKNEIEVGRLVPDIRLVKEHQHEQKEECDED